MTDWLVPLGDLDFDTQEETAALEVIRRRWLTMGAETQAFEEEFAQAIGARHAIAVTNATAALHLACVACGIGPSDEVIVPSLTFVATANAVRYVGASPVFADIQGESDLTISPQSIEARLSTRTRAIIVMHYAGFACDMPAIMKLADRYGLCVIEDAAHAAGSSLEGRSLGTWGAVGCFSFFSNKNMTTGEGGMLVTQDDELAAKLRSLRSHGMTTMTWDRHKGHAWSYDVSGLGFNYRLDEIRAAIGRVQLKKLERNNTRRKQLVEHYHELLQELTPSVGIPFTDHRGQSSYHLLCILLPKGINRVGFMENMKSQRIQTSIHYPPVHTFSGYADLDRAGRGLLPVTDAVASREVTLPLYPGLTNANVNSVVNAVAGSLKQV